jgi:hypothetical protein
VLVHDEVGDAPAALVAQHGVEQRTHVQPLDVVGEEAVQERLRSPTRYVETGHVTHVEQTRALTYGGVFRHDALELHGKRPTGELDQLSSVMGVLIVKRGLLRRRGNLSIGSNNVS